MAISSTDIAYERDGALPKPEPHVLLLFGATGDLARRKLIPGLFHLEQVGLMPEDYRIVGTSLDELDDDAFREHARAALGEFCRMPIDDDGDWRAFSERLSNVPSDSDALTAGVARAEQQMGREAQRLHYLSVPPSAAGPIVRTLGGRRAGRPRPRGHGEAVRYRPSIGP